MCEIFSEIFGVCSLIDCFAFALFGRHTHQTVGLLHYIRPGNCLPSWTALWLLNFGWANGPPPLLLETLGTL